MLYTFYTKIFINANVGVNEINENSVSSDEGMNQTLHDKNKILNYKFFSIDEKLDYLCGKNIIYKIHPWSKKH